MPPSRVVVPALEGRRRASNCIPGVYNYPFPWTKPGRFISSSPTLTPRTTTVSDDSENECESEDHGAHSLGDLPESTSPV